MLNFLAITLFLLINVAAYQLSKRPLSFSRTCLRILCWVLLVGNLLRYAVIYPAVYHIVKIPVEFSTVAYFAVPVILLADWKRMKSWAAYSGLMAGFFYYLAMMLAGETIYGADSLVNTFISLFCHGTLYLCGLVMISTERCPEEKPTKFLLCVGYVALRAAVLRPLIANGSHYLIYILLDAIPVRLVFPKQVWPTILPIYYVLVALFVLFTVSRFFRRSEERYRKFTALRA